MREPEAHCSLCRSVVQSGNDLRVLAREIGRLQAALAPLARDYGRLRRAHPRCAACGVLVGTSHVEKNLTPEPMRPRARGQRRYDVCTECFGHLHKTHRSVPQQRAYEREMAEFLGEDDADLFLEDPGDEA